jgi:hypothetical protein
MPLLVERVVGVLCRLFGPRLHRSARPPTGADAPCRAAGAARPLQGAALALVFVCTQTSRDYGQKFTFLFVTVTLNILGGAYTRGVAEGDPAKI